MEAALQAGASVVVAAITVGLPLWASNRKTRKAVCDVQDNVGTRNGQGDLMRMTERQLTQLTRIEARLDDVLQWQGKHDALHGRNSVN